MCCILLQNMILKVDEICAKNDFHLQNPTVAAQTDPIHCVVRVGDCKHLEEGDSCEHHRDHHHHHLQHHHQTWHPGKELTDEKTVVSIRQSGDMSTECE